MEEEERREEEKRKEADILRYKIPFINIVMQSGLIYTFVLWNL